MSPRGSRGAASRGARNGRGASPARGTSRGTPGRGAPITKGAPSTSRGAPNTSRGAPTTRGTPNGSRGAASTGGGASRGGLSTGSSNASGVSPGATGRTGVSNVNGTASKGTSVNQKTNSVQGMSVDYGKGIAKWLSAIRDGTLDTKGPTTTGTAGNKNSNQTAVKSVKTAGANVIMPKKQNFSTNSGPKAGKVNHTNNNYGAKDKQKTQSSVVKGQLTSHTISNISNMRDSVV